MSIKHYTRLSIERYFLNEIKGDEKAALRQHLDQCTDCQGQLNSLEIERRNYAMEHPFRAFVDKPGVIERLDRIPLPSSNGKNATQKWHVPRWLPAFAGVALCLMVLPILEKRLEHARGVEVGPVSELSVQSGIRTKGEPILEFYYKRNGVVQPGQASESYRAGDELQFVYAGGSLDSSVHGQSQGHSYITLASLDAQGLVSLYREEGESLKVSLPAKPGNRQTLPFSVTLDHSLGSELFVLVYSSNPMDGVAVETGLKQAFIQASGNLELLATALLQPGSFLPSTPSPKGDSDTLAVKTMLLRKAKG